MMGANVSAIYASFGNATVYNMVSRDKKRSKRAVVRVGKSVKADSITSHLIATDYTMLAVKNGVVAFDKAKNIYPFDGLIGCSYPVGASDAHMFVDIYTQVNERRESIR